ncbi:hypothetical protein FOCG_16959 [Fusarium oxysporum f. sp. radicis-lycopersici 26381]|uniref:Uncharacterized protein n=4 Tax=Fusarium oxysporum TaxID=5507 RepID=W9HKI4_FUSOX|nr:hypothetical protein FOXG_20701 [Fusarium oxysporum f. sp. lycopersici 4287]EWY81414.1 hypothetical protein FOYG_15661 [Fusarium oxysporum NRRL 32931]EWZ33471.1 hypothetical protein FOZG_13206 [Fusarium oxysporum Fo47]EWZ83482.1 hypothetical protein FOWG_13372 [Fusarium oxysporum f. sp. lycopersici MN25]EXK28912.1 hypothetical protein FOMG_14784 [Fusarium oxysporum f. sp. melonis 26406]EXL40538.1 hypothetical protein FOCG_16959 [Fusarium oxysporum f. sp. radicis-lycopersici 26381]KAI839883
MESIVFQVCGTCVVSGSCKPPVGLSRRIIQDIDAEAPMKSLRLMRN